MTARPGALALALLALLSLAGRPLAAQDAGPRPVAPAAGADSVARAFWRAFVERDRATLERMTGLPVRSMADRPPPAVDPAPRDSARPGAAGPDSVGPDSATAAAGPESGRRPAARGRRDGGP